MSERLRLLLLIAFLGVLFVFFKFAREGAALRDLPDSNPSYPVGY